MTAQTVQLDLSVVMIAFNEERNLPLSLASLPTGCELILLDSGSTDQTAAIAESFGAQVFQHPFQSFAEQRNHALSLASRRWVLMLDADEVLDFNLAEAIVRIVQAPAQIPQAWCLPRRLRFMNRTLRFGKTRDWPLRLFLREGARYDGLIHEVVRCQGRVRRLREGVLIHHSYHDLSDYIVRLNRYTSLLAADYEKRAQKPIFADHLLRPWLEFLLRYGLRFGFLDGYPGYCFALLSSFHAYIKFAKYHEKQRYHSCDVTGHRSSIRPRGEPS